MEVSTMRIQWEVGTRCIIILTVRRESHIKYSTSGNQLWQEQPDRHYSPESTDY